MVEGTMMDVPLTLKYLLERARTLFPRSEIVSRAADKALHRSTFGDLYPRACKLANALTRLGVKPGDRVATLCWNHTRHVEAYLAVPCMGAVLHTLNLRLHPSDLTYIAGHAGDSVVIVDSSLLPLLDKFVKDVPSIRHVIVVADGGAAPAGTLDYEALLAAEEGSFPFPDLAEGTPAAICYTSGTTGHPKGVVYTHRSTMLHTLAVCMADTMGIRGQDTLLPVVPMFHVNAWGIPFAALLTGAKLVFAGPHLDPEGLLDLMASERVTFAAGVPTIWLGILAHLDREPRRWDLGRLERMVVGGSAAPPSMIDGFSRRHGITVMHAWGMTETSPIGTTAKLRPIHDDLDDEQKLAVRSSQGYAAPLVETRSRGEDGRVLPWDGKSMGELEVRGPWVAGAYLGGEGKDRFTDDGWFRTGDVVTIDADGYVRICDRTKDVIKSGGEWISSVELENALMSHAAVLEAAVFAGRHPKWDERPIAAVVWKPGAKATEAELRAHLKGKFASFWEPDLFIEVEAIPKTSTGKFLKTKLRELYGDRLLDR
ncbi:MAG: long-chain fatty acid--CoA ligase [Myxococcales bacterium]|nr:long-chain fatty acid--CoA ligase [Myxococcales bacterium]